MTRPIWKFFVTTWAARAKAWSVASALPNTVSTVTLFGTSSHSTGAPGGIASSECSTNGNSSYAPRPPRRHPSPAPWSRPPPWRPLRRHGAPCRPAAGMCGPMNTAPPPGPVSFMSNLVFGTGSCGIGAELVGGAIGAGEHAEHAGHRLRPRGIDRDNARMRIRRAHHHRIGLAVETEIVGEAALAGDQPLILLARHRLADEAVAGFVRSGLVVHRSSLAVGSPRPFLIHPRQCEKVSARISSMPAIGHLAPCREPELKLPGLWGNLRCNAGGFGG